MENVETIEKMVARENVEAAELVESGDLNVVEQADDAVLRKLLVS